MIEEIKKFMRRVGVEQAILYGSRARGDNLKSSDVDMILISPRFEGIRFIDRLPPLHGAWHIPQLFPEVLAYTPEEFEASASDPGLPTRGLTLRLLAFSPTMASTTWPSSTPGSPLRSS